MAVIPQIREQLAIRAGYRCEYCRSPEWVSTNSFSVEHIKAVSAGGEDSLGNLAFSCQGCNNHKYIASSAIDPLSGENVPLFHPRLDVWTDHFAWSSDKLEIMGLSPQGRATVLRLKLNRPNLLNLRRVCMPSGDHPPPDA